METCELLDERPKYVYTDCKILDFKLKIDLDLINKFKIDQYTFNNVLHYFIKFSNNVCGLYIRSTRKLKSVSFTLYGYCIHYGCCCFLLKIDSQGEIQVFRNRPEILHNSNARLTTQFTNIERHIMQSELLHPCGTEVPLNAS